MLSPLPETCLLDAEARLGVTFPACYRRWLLRRNGGAVEIEEVWWDLHPVADTTCPNRMGPTWDDVCRQTQLARMLGGFPATAVAIGDDGSGDRLVLVGRDGDQTLQLAVWRHETGRLVWPDGGVDAVFA